MEEHTDDCRIYDDGSCCDCGYITDTKWPKFKGPAVDESTDPVDDEPKVRRA